MKKADLQTGMWVECCNDGKYCVMIGTPRGDILTDGKEWLCLSNFNEQLRCEMCKKFDIAKVYEPTISIACLNGETLTLIWQREEIKEVTMAEIEEKFGCPVKIIKE